MSLADIARELRPYTDEEVQRDWETLTRATSPTAHAGRRVCDRFFLEHRLAASNGQTFLEWLDKHRETPWVLRFLPKTRRTGLRAYYETWRRYGRGGSVGSFPPAMARHIYQRYGARSVLDPCAGWGGRCLAALSMGLPYYGWDTNTDLRRAYEALASWVAVRGGGCPSTPVLQYQNAAEADFSQYRYDMVLTSPPYWTGKRATEVYPHMPAWESREAFEREFLRPVVQNCWTHLVPGGHLCFNVPDGMLAVLVDVVGRPPDETVPMSLARRRAQATYSESVHVWRKAIPQSVGHLRQSNS